MKRKLTGFTTLLLALILLSPLAAQEAKEPDPEVLQEEPGQTKGIEPWIDHPASYYAAGKKPAPVERTFSKRTRKVWKAILEALEEAEVAIEEEDREAGIIRTRLRVFGPPKTRWGNVALHPPEITMERPIVQRRGLNSGKFSLVITMKETPEGTTVSIEPYIEELARHLAQQRKIAVERYSNGTLEKFFFERIDGILN